MALATPDIGAVGPSAPSTFPRYDVFLSFHREDFINGFVDHLNSALRRNGILTFKVDEHSVYQRKKKDLGYLSEDLRDEDFFLWAHIDEDLVYEDLKRGHMSIFEDGFLAIEQSQFAIVVLSENYFSTPGCLEVLRDIIEIKQGQTIFPVFYGIDPSDVRHVRHQRGSVAAAFKKLEAIYSVDEVKKWREASAKIAYLPGWDTIDWHEAEIVEDIVKFVRNKFCYKLPSNFDHPVEDIVNNLVGDFQSKVDKIISLLKIGLDDINFVGICGMDGLGKTTLARGVYEAVHSKFDACCFLPNIKIVYTERRFEQMQMMLLSQLGLVQDIDNPLEGESVIRGFLRNKKVLIILDDVYDKRQLETLAGSEEWFGHGSKILITTRDESLLTVYKQFEIYEIEALNRDESLKLFCQLAFIKNEPEQGYLDLSEEIIKHARGVPLQLEALGLFLCGKTQSEWRETLDKCRERLPKEILNVHRISYKGLDDACQDMFLDFACFFNGRTKFEVVDMLKTFYLRPMHEIEVLIAKSLLISVQSTSNSRHNVEEGQDMHDRPQKMRSDVSLGAFLYHKLPHETAQESLHMHNFLQEMGRNIVYRDFPTDPSFRSRLWNIKDIDCVLKGTTVTHRVEKLVVNLRHPFKADWHPECFSTMSSVRLLDLSRVELAHNLNCLPCSLQFLRWDYYALASLPPFDQLYKLKSLQLRSSSIQRLWHGAPELHRLTTVDLSNSQDLEETPDFSGTPNLEMLFFNYCKKLTRVHKSVGQLKKLAKLSFRYCTNLKTLPTCLDMNNLEVFILGECSKLEKLPKFTKNMRRLYLLDVMNTMITEVPLSIINLENLKYLDLSGCCIVKSIPLLPPNSIIRANKDPFVPTTLDLQHLIGSRRVSKHPIHLVVDSKVKEEVPPWFEQQEVHHGKDDSSEVVTLTADIPSDLANSEGECLGIAVCIIFECLTEEAWRRFTINWKFQDCPHTNDTKGGRSHRTYAGSEVDSKAKTIHSKTIVDDDPQAEIECRVYKGFFPIDKEKCRQHPSGGGRQVDLTLRFPTMNAVGRVNIVHSKETSFGDLEVVDCGWRLVCEKDLDAGSARVRREAEIAEHLVGDIQSKVDWIISLLKMELNDTCFIGIWGNSGIGKTTLARLVYDEMQSKFGATCFLDNVREDSERVGIVSLQKKLLSELGLGERDIDDSVEGAKIIRKCLCHKKVLLILDDVSQRNQLENLVGNKEWFGAGSKIVITTTDKTLLTLYEQFEEYEVGRLHPDESLELFCLEAFKKDEPEEDYVALSIQVIEYACGLPLVLKVLGSFLCKKDNEEWRNALQRLSHVPSTDISRKLRISYDGLEDKEYKRIFLDIACFFNREVKFKVTDILEFCCPESTSGILHAKKKASDLVKDLIQKSMLNVTHSNSDLRQNAKEDHNMLERIQNMRKEIFLPTYLYDWLLQEASKEYLYMHCLLQEMGRDIVFQESLADAGGRSRLWSLEDIDDVLKEHKGTENVHSIVLYEQQSFEADWHPDCFSNMQELRLLDLSKVHLSRDLKSLPSALKIMRWDYYALESLPPVDQLHELISLQLRNSKITRLWDGTPELHKLRTIDLSNSDLVETPDFSGTPNLEKLLFNYCENLVRVHKSVRKLQKLVELSLRYCTNLETLPTRLGMHKLEVLILGECSNLEKLPKFSKNMRSLYFLDVRGTDITEIPRSIIRLKNLKYLDLTFCSRLKSIPKLPPNLIISASNCRLLEPTSALRHLYASCAPKGPIHLFYDFQLLTRIPAWFERWEYCWGKDTSGEFVTITADIPSHVVADSNEERWGIAVCVVFQFLSRAWLGFSVDWKFNDKCHSKKTKINGTPASFMHDCRVYVGFCPLDAIHGRQLASGEGSQLDLTLEFPTTNIVKGLHDLEIMGCGWRLACGKDFDEWSETARAPSPPRLGFLNDLNSGESSNISII